MNTRIAAVWAALLVVASCGDSTGGDDGRVQSIDVEARTVELFVGDTMTLRAIPKGRSGAPVAGVEVEWTLGDTARASLAPDGDRALLTARRAGAVAVTAAAQEVAKSVDLAILARVASVELDVDSIALAEGAQRQFTATARDADGQVVTGRAVVWSSADPGVAHVGALGLVTAIRPGTVELRARVDGDTGRAKVVVSSDYDYDLTFTAWSGVGGEWPRLRMVDINEPDRATTELSASVGVGAADLAVSPTGSHYVVAGIVGTTRGLYIVERDGSNPQLVLADSVASQPAWSPDGEKIAFRRWPIGAGADVWIMNADGTDLVNLTADQGTTGQHTPAFSPLATDGTYRIAYSHSPGPTAHIWTMNPDGSDKQQVTSGEEFDDRPAWSPDGALIAFQRTANDIWVVSPSGTGARVFVSLPFAQLSPQWSPDGVLLAFASKDAAGLFQLFTVRADGSGLAQRTADPYDKQQAVWVAR